MMVFIISAPSGSGKSTLVSRLFQEVPNLFFSVSYTTRMPRGTERDGQSYNYISRDEFERRIAADEFLEWAKVFDNYYGTHRSVLDRAEEQGCDVVLDIDVQGAAQLKNRVPGAVSIFILAPSRAILEQRLRARSEDSDEVIRRRLQDAKKEISNYRAYDYVLINNDLEKSAATLAGIVRAERTRRARMEEQVKPILETFEDSLVE
jgi:guanylate kinase